MLDFMDLTIDSQGRVVGAFADGCVVGSCDATSPPSASRSALGTIVRQSGGRRLFPLSTPSSLPSRVRLYSVLRCKAKRASFSVGRHPMTAAHRSPVMKSSEAPPAAAKPCSLPLPRLKPLTSTKKPTPPRNTITAWQQKISMASGQNVEK